MLLTSACAHARPTGQSEPEALWETAQQALLDEEYEPAEAGFRRLAGFYPATEEGRDALFYIGAIRLDPLNPAWDPQPAEAALRQYVEETGANSDALRPEALTLLRLAAQLNMPAEQRVPGLAPATRVVTVPQRVVGPAGQTRALRAEIEALRQQVTERDEQIRRQREELERIRRTLTPRTP